MKKVISRLFVMVALVLVATYAWAAPGAVNAQEYQSRLEALKSNTQSQVATLSEEAAATTDVAQQEKIAARIIELKRQSEIERLQILLEWAEADADEARIIEIQEALTQLVNPPQPQALPQIERDADGKATSPASENLNNR